jgi:hypothetical protein
MTSFEAVFKLSKNLFVNLYRLNFSNVIQPSSDIDKPGAYLGTGTVIIF